MLKSRVYFDNMHLFSSFAVPEWGHPAILGSNLLRLLLAGALGGIIGLERTIHHKSAGIRTNMFICMGAALFTIMSELIPDPSIGDRTRIASNIVQGVGFLGAGAILHNKGGVSGLTTAATIWVVASIGMAAGAGHYVLATLSGVIILIALNLLGYLEARLGLKPITVSYEVTGKSAPEILDELNRVFEETHHFMHGLQVGRSENLSRVIFDLTCTLPEHRTLETKMKMQHGIESVTTFTKSEEE
ncbi:MAG TPA: MgtC/SapB family protein [Candidatus Sulfotelmatobacter sp.]|nr:MgtC/SapB family protein [Candidatus Sulfotelmatobacter sp.]